MFQCKLCDREVDVVTAVCTADIVSAWVAQGVLLPSPDFEKVFLTYCPYCSFEAWQPAWVGDSEFYVQLSSFPWYYESNKWEYQVALKWLKRDSKVLEIGCGKGEFLKLLAHEGIEAVGLDTNLNAVELASANGLQVVGVNVFDYAASVNLKFDVICSFQILEHIADPLPFLRTCKKLLKPHGEIWVATPNQASFIQHVPYLLSNMPPHHQTRWTESAYLLTSYKLGLKLDRIEFEPLYKLHTGLAMQSLVNKYFKVGLDRPFSKKQHPVLKLVIFKMAEIAGRILFYPTWARNRIRGHSILVVMSNAFSTS